MKAITGPSEAERVIADDHDLSFAKIRLIRDERSKNGYVVYINDVCVLTSGPIEIDREGHYWPRVTLTLVTEELIEE